MTRLPLDDYAQFTRHLGDREFFGMKLGLERVQAVLQRLGNPERNFSSIHIAGTNGKGSTACFLAGILRQAGYRVGLYTSPHLVDFCERIRVGAQHPPEADQPPAEAAPLHITPDDVLRLGRIITDCETEPLTFFEMTTVMALLYFAEHNTGAYGDTPLLAILETGLGGRLDATNVVTPLVSVITTIGFDHQQYLGDSLEKIAAEKGGIIKPGVPVVCGVSDPGPRQVLERMAAERKAPWIPVGAYGNTPLQDRDYPLGLAGEYQRLNAALAVAVVNLLANGGPVGAYCNTPLQNITDAQIRAGLLQARWPGRLESIQTPGGQDILLDGAHNVPAMQALVDHLKKTYAQRPIHLLFGAMSDKDWPAMLRLLAPLCQQATFVRPNLKRAEDPLRFQELAQSVGLRSEVVPAVAKGFSQAMAGLPRDGLLLVTGSLFVVGNVHELLKF